MATYFSLRDGLLTDTSTYGYSLSGAEVMNGTTGTMLLTSSQFSPAYTSDGSTLSAVAVHLSARSTNPTGTLSLTLQRSTSSSNFKITEVYPISSFTSYDGSNNLTTYSQNWQLLKLTNPLSSSVGESINFSLSTSNPNQLSLIGAQTAVDATGLNQLGVTRTVTTGSVILSSGKPYSNFGDSYFFNGTDNWFVAPAKPYYNLAGDFTIEFWINTSVFSQDTFYRRIVSFGADAANNLQILFFNGVGATNRLNLYSNTTLLTGTSAVADGNWHHVAIVRNSNVLRLFVDGGQSGAAVSNAVVYNAGATNLLSIGAYNNTAAGRLSGCINEFRIVNGTAVYTTESFSPPTTPLEYIPNTVFLMKNGVNYDKALITASNISELTGTLLRTGTTLSAASPFGDGVDGSILFNGTITDGITANNTITFGTNDFTVELWANIGTFSNTSGRTILDGRPMFTNNNNNFSLWFNTNTRKLRISRDSTVIIDDPNDFPLNQWTHVAYSRSANTGRLYVNGVLKGSANDNSNYGASNFKIGKGAYTSSTDVQVLTGYLSNVRIINGEGIYTSSSITPPASPLNLYFRGNGYTEFLYKSPYSTDYLYNLAGLAANNIYISSLLDGYNTQTITVTADDISLDSLAVHNKGTLTFPQSSTTLTVTKSAGLMVTSEGTLQIGTSSNLVPLSAFHTLNLRNLNVSNGGSLSLYGAYKPAYEYLKADAPSGSNDFLLNSSLSSFWLSEDDLAFIPNLTGSNTVHSLRLSGFSSGDRFRTITNSSALYNSISSNPYIPTVSNLTRNVLISGTSTTSEIGIYGSLDSNKINFNNSRIDSMDLLLDCNNSNFTTSISGNVFRNNTIDFCQRDFAYVTTGQPTSYINSTFTTGSVFTGVFTMEWFAYNGFLICEMYHLQNNQSGWTIYGTAGGKVEWSNIAGADTYIIQSNSNLPANRWNHIAFTRDSNNILRLYINGILDKSITLAGAIQSSNTGLFIGRLQLDSSYFYTKSIVSNLRFIKDQCLYSSDFTVPTSRLTLTSQGAIPANVRFLSLTRKTLKDDSYYNNTITSNNIFIVDDHTPFNTTIPYRILNLNFSNNILTNSDLYALSLSNANLINCDITNNMLLSSHYSSTFNPTNNIRNKFTYVTEFNRISAYNTNIHSNYIVGGRNAGCYMYNVSSDSSSRIEVLSYKANLSGIVVAGSNDLTLSLSSVYSQRDGIHIDASENNLNSLTFKNILTNNNSTLGFKISGNSLNYLTPITLNINGLIANDNLSGGFEGYNISGNLSGLELNRNGLYGMKTSIGNAPTTIDGITALINNVATASAGIGILSGYNYYQTLIKNANVGKAVGSSSFGSGIILDSTKFSQFVVTNSTVSGGSSDFRLLATRNVLEGSYLISNTNIGNLPVGAGVTSSNYQSDVLKTAGFAFTNMNNASGYNVTYLAAGTRQIDSTVNITAGTSPSERLTPQSTTLKLRSGSKFVALNSGNTTTVSVYVRKSTVASNGVAYNGSAPRLIMKRNPYMGRNSDIVMDQLDTTSENFLKLTGTIPAVTDSGVLEFYVDCDGTQGFINIDNWTAN